MRVVSVNCNHCGAPLEVPAKTRFVTCNYCSARLEIHRSQDAVYTEVLESIDERTEQIANDVEVIKAQNRLERLDREWVSGRQQYMIRGKDGEYRIPSTAGSVVGAGVAVVFGIFWMVMASSIGGGPFALFGLAFIAVAVIGAFVGVSKAGKYENDRRSYERSRREILRDIDDGGN